MMAEGYAGRSMIPRQVNDLTCHHIGMFSYFSWGLFGRLPTWTEVAVGSSEVDEVGVRSRLMRRLRPPFTAGPSGQKPSV